MQGQTNIRGEKDGTHGLGEASSGDISAARGSQSGEQPQGQEDGDALASLLTQRGGIQEAVFGVLHMLSKERLVDGWRFAMSVMVLEYLQLAVFFIGYNFPWKLDFTAWYWKWPSWLCFANLFPQGTGLINGNYLLYVVILHTLAGVLLLSAAVCVFMGIRHKGHQSLSTWVTKGVKIALTFFFDIFYVSTLGLFVLALDCTYSDSSVVSEKFRSVQCFQMPNLGIIAVSIAAALLLLAMSYFTTVARSEHDPTSKELSAQAHNRSAFWRCALVSLLTIINQVFPSYTKIQAIACIIITTYLCYMYVRYIPFRTAWTNGLQASFFASLSWASFLIVLMAFFYQSSDKLVFTVLLWAGLVVVVPLVWGVLYLRMHHVHKVALMYRLGLKDGGGPVIHKFIDELEVEVVARCGRIRDRWGDVVPAWIDTAEVVYKAGLQQFPDSAYLHIAYSSFLTHQRGTLQAGAGLLEVARKLETSIGERYMIFVREREQKERGGSASGGGDLLSYVEFKNNLDALLDVHRQALRANRSFWRLLVRKDVAFGDLTAAFAAMEAAEKRADSTFNMVLDRYPNSPKLLQAFALYLESVKSNPSRASRYRAEADRLEKESSKAPQTSALTDGREGPHEAGAATDATFGALADISSTNSVVIINSMGIIQFVNKKALELFGYKQGELEQKNVKMLLPPPFSTNHSQYIQRHLKTGKAVHIGKPAVQRVALHAQGYSFPVSIAIKQLQRGGTTAFMGILKPIQEDLNLAVFWVNTAGHIMGLNKGAIDFCGYSLPDVRGEFVGSLGEDGGMEQHFRHISELLKTWKYNEAELDSPKHTFQVSMKHKYGAVALLSGTASFSGTENARTIVLKFTRDEYLNSLGLISLTPAGQVIYANAALEAMLGYEPGILVAKRKALPDLMRSPYSQLHLRWMQQVAQSVDTNSMAPCSCRTGRTVLLLGRNNKQVPVRLQVVEAQVGKVSCLTATVTEVEDPLNSSKQMLLLVHADGRVLAAKADPATALHGFGQDAAELCTKSLPELVQDFSRPAGPSQLGWTTVPQLLSRLSQETSKMQAAGRVASFRVGVLPSAAAAKQLKQRTRGVSSTLPSTIPCRMAVLPVANTEVDVQQLVDEGAVKQEDVYDGESLHVVTLRQDGMLEAVLEIDPQLRIKAADAEAALLFGSNALKGHSITKFIKAPAGHAGHATKAEEFLALKRTQLKHGGDQAVGEKLEMEALHVDGSRTLVQMQGADKYGNGSRWVVRVTVHPTQPASWVRPNLVEAASRCGAVAVTSPHSSLTNSPEPEDKPIAALSAPGAAAKAQSADGRSEHSMEDGASHNDGASSVNPEELEMRGNYSDHQRAKRLRKLNSLLSSPKAQRSMRRLKRVSLVMVILLLAVHALFLGLTIQGINDYSGFIQDVVDAGDSCSYCSKMMSAMRILVSSTDAGNPRSLRHNDPAMGLFYVNYYLPWIQIKAALLEKGNRDIMFGTDPSKLDPPPTEFQRMLFISTGHGIVAKEVLPFRQYNSSLWDLTLRYTTAARLVATTAPTPAGSALANYTEVGFMSLNDDTLGSALLESLQSQREVSDVKLAQQTKEMIIFVVSEAGGLILLCCLCLYILLNLVNRVRFQLFSVFLAVPWPVVMQLATKEVQVSLDDDEGEDDDGEAWLRQQADAGSAGADPAKGVGFNLTSGKRKLGTRGLATHLLLVPFLLWCTIVVVVYAISIARLQGSSASVANLVAAQIIHWGVTTALSKAIGMVFCSTAAQATLLQGQLGAVYRQLQLYINGLLYGDPSLGLEGALRQNSEHEQLWFGQGCLNRNVSKCIPPTDPYYQITNNGLNQLANMFIEKCAELTILRPAFNITFSTKQFAFLWAVSREGKPLEDGIITNTLNFAAEGQGRVAIITTLQVVAMILGVAILVFFQFWMLLPFLRHSKKESRRVAELLSQLPPELDVMSLVLSSTNQQEEEEVSHRQQGSGGVLGALAHLLGSCWGHGKAGGSSDPGHAHGSEATGLSIVVSKNTSKDQEVAAPAVGTHDVSRKVKVYTEQMHRHHSEGESEAEDPTLWDSHRTPRKISFMFPT